MAVELSTGASQRFWGKVAKEGADACWLWKGAVDKDGYGVFGVSSAMKSARAHRVAWQLSYGDPGRALVLHDCDTPSCCNPGHLHLGTPKENMLEKMTRGRHVSGMRVHPERAARGSRHGGAKLTEDQVRSIRARYVPRKVTLKQLAREFGVRLTTIHRALTDGWRHVDER